MTAASMILVFSMLFLQEGVTYHLSFQVLAVFALSSMLFSAGVGLKIKVFHFAVFLTFCMSVIITALFSPRAISTNSTNIYLTVLGLLAYASWIFSYPHLKVNRPVALLHALRFTSTMVIWILFVLLLISESNLVPPLSRDALLQQNSRLIDNYTDMDAIIADMALRDLVRQAERIDLFYGEPSYLAVVLFACLGCSVFSNRILGVAERGKGVASKRSFIVGMALAAPYVSALFLLYIQSLSSIIYAMISLYFLLFGGHRRRLLSGRMLVLMCGFSLIFGLFSYDYFLYRITMSDSLSFIQRFGFVFDIGLVELLLGVKDVALLPEVGIHNGLFYIIAIAGFGGVLYLAILLKTAYALASPLGMSMFAVLLISAVVMQNGGVFSPSKVVMFGLILLPLACARSVGMRCTMNTEKNS